MDLGWVDLNFWLSTVCPILPGPANGNFAEEAMQLGKMVAHPNQSHANLSPREDGTSCSITVTSI